MDWAGYFWRLRNGLKHGWSPEKALAAEVLKDSLTTRGIDQWWVAKNRYLKGFRPCDVSGKLAREAAEAFRDGAYL